jgi:hypothetical protein
MNVWAASFALLACGLGAWVWWTIKQDTKRMVEDFQRMFPGRCAVCSFHRWGVMEGHERGPVEPHDCIERAEEPISRRS